MGERRVPEEMAEPGHADPAGPEVLVPVEPRPALRLRVVEMEHDEAIEPDPGIEVGQEGVDGVGLREVDPGRPRVRGVEAEADPAGRQATSGGGLRDPRQLVDIHPEPEPAPRRVLEDDHRRVGAVVHLGQDEREAIGQARGAGRPRPTPDASRRGR